MLSSYNIYCINLEFTRLNSWKASEFEMLYISLMISPFERGSSTQASHLLGK